MIMNNNAKMWLGFMAGLAAGIGVYAFLQSERGKEMVNDLKEKLDDLKDDVADMMDKGRKTAQDMKESFESFS